MNTKIKNLSGNKGKVLTLKPYDFGGMMVFDDADTGLVQEPFVMGVPEILYGMCEVAGIRNAETGFVLKFSDQPFQGHMVKAEWVREEDGGNWYNVGGHVGWLCPALFKYYDEAPAQIFISVENPE